MRSKEAVLNGGAVKEAKPNQKIDDIFKSRRPRRSAQKQVCNLYALEVYLRSAKGIHLPSLIALAVE